ncbi:MAG: DUF4157 domain-containing protein [Bacteroidota bacterium]
MRTTTKHQESSSKAKSNTFFSPTTIQPKLTIGQPNDKYEQEADAMADQVMRMPQDGIQRACAECEKEKGIQPKLKRNFLSLKRKIQKMGGMEEEQLQMKSNIQRMEGEEEMLQTKPLMMKSEGGGGVATAALTSQLNSSKGGGSPLSDSTNSFMSNAFGTDFSNVRVHTDSNAIQMNQGLNARAFTHGSDVYFNKGEYSPNSDSGKRLLGHELTHVVQQKENLIQRRERSANTSEEDLEQGDWRPSDRVLGNVIWQRANIINLANGNASAYTQPHERRDFYLWFYNYTSGLGYETRWALAAYLVASGAAQLSYGSPFSNDVQIAARRGNQVIFDDVFPKLQALLNEGPLRGDAAVEWDAKTLSEEQTLIQSMYDDMSQETIDEFAGYARQEGALAWAGKQAGFAAPHRRGRFHRQMDMPAFSGDIMDIDDRFDYGMRLADDFSTHPSPSSPVQRPEAREAYRSGSAFDRLDNQIGLHRLDAELDDFNVDEERVIDIIQNLTSSEQRQLGNNNQRLEFIANALSEAEFSQAISGKERIPSWVIRRIRALI